jgi:hypothetical protein
MGEAWVATSSRSLKYVRSGTNCVETEQKNQIQPHEQHAECDPGDRYVEQNTHDRGPPRWPSTDLKIYGVNIYTERAFLAQVATFRE